MPQCYVSNCFNYYEKTRDSKVSYHMAPAGEGMALKWAMACKARVHTPPRHMRVCSDHFSESCFLRDLQHELLGLPLRRRLKPDAVPDQNLPTSYVEAPKQTRKQRNKENNTNITYKIPMRSSLRIARKETVGSLADLHSPKFKKARLCKKKAERERFVRKIKYMRQLKLNFQKNERAADGTAASPAKQTPRGSSDLNKMHIMEDVREACNTQPSSPGHADHRTDIVAESAPPSDDDSSTTNKPPDDAKLEDEENSTEYTSLRPEDSPSKDDSKKPEEPEDNSVSPKRKSSPGIVEESPVTKKPKTDMQHELLLRNKILSEITESLDMSNFDQIQAQTEQLVLEIHNLTLLAKEKEREWNNIIHLKKMKEELLLRIQRQKQVCLLSNGLEISESDPGENGGQKLALQRRKLSQAKLIKSLQTSFELNGHDSKGKQRPVRDVQSIIADYRQRHPETVPRRGRRIRSSVNGQEKVNNGNGGGVLNFSNVALGSGSQVRQNVFDSSNELGMLLSAMESVNQDVSSSSGGTETPETTSFKDILVRFARLSQSDRQELLQSTIKPPPPPYPEVTVHPVAATVAATVNAPPPPNNSLLHGILTKAQNKPESKSSFSPTLARLLTAPERSVATQRSTSPSQGATAATTKAAANVSISDILSSNKARNEITITPVGGEYESSPKRKSQVDEDEAEDSVDRLVIDESDDIIDARADNNSDTGDEVPQCQGCNTKAAQFVCAGCGNQWYCSRECQVSAWDEHSEVCSG